MDLPPGVRKVLLFGGTFDPVHLGHTRAAAAARDQVMGPEAWLVFVPAARSPLKEIGPIAGDADRLDMLRAALREMSHSTVWTDELTRPPPSFWIDTLRRARSLLGRGVELRFLIGADQAIEFQGWREWREIMQTAEPVVMARPPVRTADEFARALSTSGWSHVEVKSWAARFVGAAILEISAREIRSKLATGQPACERELAPEVLAIVRARGLYREPKPCNGPSLNNLH